MGRVILPAGVRRAAAPVLGMAAVYGFFVLTSIGRRLDEAATYAWPGPLVRRFDHALLSSLSSAGALAVVAVVVLIASLRGRWRRGLQVAVAVVGSAVSAEVLKLVLPSYRWYNHGWEWGGSFPSGHTAVASALALAVLSVCSQRWRRVLIGPAVAVVMLTATATVTVNWHRPADVFGGFLLALAWHRAAVTGEPVRRVTGALRGAGGFFALVTAAGVVGLAARSAVLAGPLRLPPWVPEPLDHGHGLVYVGSLLLICVAAAATVLGASFPVSGPSAPMAGKRAAEPVGSAAAS